MSGTVRRGSSIWRKQASTMGMSIKHVAVLLIHIDSKAADNINAKTSILLPCLALALLLTKRKMAIAKRLCAPDRSKPLAIIKPPISSKIICEPSPAADSLWVRIPSIGNPAKGINEVAGIGIASVAHHHATNIVRPAVALAG